MNRFDSSIEEEVSMEFNAQPYDERVRVGRMMHYERISELKRQRSELKRDYERKLAGIDKMIHTMRGAIVESRRIAAIQPKSEGDN